MLSDCYVERIPQAPKLVDHVMVTSGHEGLGGLLLFLFAHIV